MSKDFNKVLENQIESMILTDAVSNEIKMIDGNYLLTVAIEKIEDDEE